MAYASRRGLRWLLGGFLLLSYASVLCVGPVFHHDFDCHLKSPAHCPACLASPTALRGETTTNLAETPLPPAEAVGRRASSDPTPPILTASKGRSPPA